MSGKCNAKRSIVHNSLKSIDKDSDEVSGSGSDDNESGSDGSDSGS